MNKSSNQLKTNLEIQERLIPEKVNSTHQMYSL